MNPTDGRQASVLTLAGASAPGPRCGCLLVQNVPAHTRALVQGQRAGAMSHGPRVTRACPPRPSATRSTA